eukprot:COSAG06_NODE_63549_length_262_cov_0.625767_1_plen_39_part_10
MLVQAADRQPHILHEPDMEPGNGEMTLVHRLAQLRRWTD